MSDVVFQYSEKRFTATKQVGIFMGLLMPVLLAIFVFASPNFSEASLKDNLIVFIFTIVTIELVLAGVYAFVISQLRKTKLLVSSQFIERSMGGTVERITYNEINKIRVYENPDGKILAGIIYLNKPPFTLGGYNKVDEMVSLIVQNINDPSKVERKIVTKKIPVWVVWRVLGLSMAFSVLFILFITFLG